MIIKKDNPATINAFRNCIAKVVSDISRAQYYFNDQEDKDGLGDLQIKFTDNSYLTLSGIGDAESIKAVNEKAKIYEAFEVSDNNVASWKLLCLSDHQDWKKIIGQKLQKVEVEWIIYEPNENNISACILYFDTDYISFYGTNSDTTNFSVNVPLPEINVETRIEVII